MKVLIATAMYPTPENPAFGSFVRTQVEALKQAGVAVELLILAGQPRKLIYPKGIVQLRQRLADRSIDLVHAHFSYVGMVARTQWKVPVVVTYHGDDLLGTVMNEQGEHSRFSEMMVVAGQALARTVDASIVQSEEMAAKLAPNKRVYIVPHEVDFETFYPVDKTQARSMLGLAPEKKYLLFAANPQTLVKHFSLAQAAADQVIQQDPTVELLVVYKETQDRLSLYMNAADALIFPSFQEGSPNIVKQAMACNLPIVATDVGDVRDVIGKTADCYVCPPNPTVLAERLSQVLVHCNRTQGREQIRHFDRPLVTRRIIDVYEAALQRRKSGSFSVKQQFS